MSSTRSLKWQARNIALVPASLQRCVAASVLGLLTVAAIVILSRRLAGSLLNPLPPFALLTTAVLVATAAAGVRIGWFCGTPASSRLDLALMVLTSLAALTLIGTLCLPGTPLPWVFLAAVLLAAEEACAWRQKRGQNYFPSGKTPAAPPMQRKNSSDPFSPTATTFRFDSAHPAASRHAGQSEVGCAAVAEVEQVETIPPPDVLQQLTRSQAADGAEELFGWIRLPFAPGQRTGSIHVAFCPPLAVTPEVTVEQIEGPDARVKTAQLLPYGARFDLKLAATAEASTTVVLQFLARTPKKA